jgi:hypothetical protein
VHDELERRERRRQRLDSDTRIALGPAGPSRAPVMRRARSRRIPTRRIRRRFPGGARRDVGRRERPLVAQRAYQQFLARDPVEQEPARVAPYQPFGDPFAARHIPDDLGRGEAFADRVEDVVQHALEVERAAADEVAHQVRRALVLGRFGSRRDD